MKYGKNEKIIGTTETHKKETLNIEERVMK